MSEKQITVRPVQEGDYDAWFVLWKGYQTFYKTDIPIEATLMTWKRFFDETEPIYGAVAVDENGKIVGLTHYLYHRTTWTIEKYCYLEDLFVDPEQRGGGVGKKLIEFVQAEANKEKCSRLYWHTQNGNATARRLYDYVANLTEFVKYQKAL